ncbi:MAG: PAS domain S-box protein [Candidatus Zixiibacteriota bacterium]
MSEQKSKQNPLVAELDRLRSRLAALQNAIGCQLSASHSCAIDPPPATYTSGRCIGHSIVDLSYEELFNAIEEGIGIVDENEVFIFVNPACAAIFDQPYCDAVLGTTVFDYINDDYRPVIDQQTALRKSNHATRYELPIISRKGVHKHVLVSATPRFGRDGEYLGAIGALLDITARKKMEGSVRKAEERYRLLFEGAEEGIVVAQGSAVRLANPAFTKLIGYSLEELMSLPFAAVIHPDDRDMVIDRYRRRLAGQQVPTGYDFRIITRYGETRWVRIHASLIRWEGEDAILCFLADVTELKRLQEQAERAQRLEAAGRIAGQVAHDFNNLLGPLVAYPQIVREELGKDHPATVYLDTIESAAEQMAEINQQLLALGRRGHYDLEPVNINDVIRLVLDQIGPRSASLVIDTRLADDLLAIKAGASQMMRVLLNVATNAIDAMPEAGLLTISTENWCVNNAIDSQLQIEPGEYVKVTISDTGPGIPEYILDRVFEPFFTTKKADKKRGSGLGLSVVHAIVQDHKGYIDIAGTPGEGTSVHLYFPATREAVAGPDETMIVGGTESVLVIDDDALQREVVQNLLDRLGYRAEAVRSGEIAATLLGSRKFDLLLIDMTMPSGMDGVDVFRRAVQLNPEQKAIIISGFAESERVEEARRLGVGAFVKKPLTLRSLATAVRRELDCVIGKTEITATP